MKLRTTTAKSALLFGAGLLTAVGYASAGLAQTQSDQADEETRSTVGRSDEIIVTANRREQNVLDVPQSITALSGDDLVDKNQDSLADYIRQVPGVVFSQQSSGLNQITIRGVTGGFQRAKAPVSFYIDDMPVVSDPSATPDVRSFDVERVEILRGPQGTLFGESAIGGVIRIISKRPSLEGVEGRLQVGYNNYAHGSDGYRIDGMVNIPLIDDKLAFRGSISHRNEGGYIDNIGLGIDNQNTLDYLSGRGTLLFKASERLDISATAYFVRSDYGAFPAANRDYKQSRLKDETRKDDMNQFNLTLNYDLDFATLTSSSNYSKRTTSRLFDLTAAFRGFLPPILTSIGAAPAGFQFDQFWQTLDINDKSFAQEIRLVSPSDQKFRWTVGLYYFDTKNFVSVDFLSKPDLNFNYLSLRRDERYEQKAVFAEAEYDILPQLTAVVGARYSHENRVTEYNQSDDFPFRLFLAAEGRETVDVSYGILTPKFALRYKPSDDTQIYASATRGFRGPGGNTAFGDSDLGNSQFGAETLWSYELGAKGRFFDRVLTLEGAVFRSDWKDRQEVVNPQALPPQQVVGNIGDATLEGAELSASIYANKYFTFGGQVSYLMTNIDKSTTTFREGTELTFQPNWIFSAFADGRTPISDKYTAKAHFDITHQGNSFWSITPASSTRFGKYTMLNASIGIETDRWNLDLVVKNISDEFIPFGPLTATDFIIGEPRSIGVSFGVKF